MPARPALAWPRRRRLARPCACPRRRRLDCLHAPLPAAAIGRRPSARGRPPHACACGRRSGLRLPACATTKSTWDRPWASWPSFCCGYSTSCPSKSPSLRRCARGAARSSGSTACPCQRRYLKSNLSGGSMRHLLLRLSGHRDEDMGRRHRFFQLDDRKHLRVRFTAWS